VSAPITIPRTPIEAEEIPADDGLSLLLDLFALESSAEEPRHRPVDRHRVGLRARVQDWTRRAALWGAGPQGAWRAW
jgi:hypothetical protein